MSTIINATTTNGVVIQPDNSGSLQLATNSGTTAVTINTSQNVGIGTASPSVKLEIAGGVSTQQVAGRYYGFGSSGFSFDSTTVNDYGITYTQPGSDFNTVLVGYSNIKFATNQTERMRINSSGNVLIGTTTVGGALTVFASSGVGARIRIQELGPTIMQFRNAQDLGGTITIQSGGGTSYNTTSDYRLKENILPMTGALDKVSQLKPVTYKWKIGGSDGQGFIAHELQEVVPDAVTGEKDEVETYTDEDGIEQTRPKYQGVDTSFLVATLTAAIQEQQTIINDLKARIETLEAK